MTLSVHQRRLFALISEWKREGVPTSALQPRQQRGASGDAGGADASVAVAVTAIPLGDSLHGASPTVADAEVVVIIDESHGARATSQKSYKL